MKKSHLIYNLGLLLSLILSPNNFNRLILNNSSNLLIAVVQTEFTFREYGSGTAIQGVWVTKYGKKLGESNEYGMVNIKCEDIESEYLRITKQGYNTLSIHIKNSYKLYKITIYLEKENTQAKDNEPNMMHLLTKRNSIPSNGLHISLGYGFNYLIVQTDQLKDGNEESSFTLGNTTGKIAIVYGNENKVEIKSEGIIEETKLDVVLDNTIDLIDPK